MKTDFSSQAYFACHNPRNWHRQPRRRRVLTPAQAAIFHAAKAMIADGRSIEDAVAWARKEARR